MGAQMSQLQWDETRPAFYETQAPDGSLWSFSPHTGEVLEITDIHLPIIETASWKKGAEKLILAHIGAGL